MQTQSHTESSAPLRKKVKDKVHDVAVKATHEVGETVAKMGRAVEHTAREIISVLDGPPTSPDGEITEPGSVTPNGASPRREETSGAFELRSVPTTPPQLFGTTQRGKLRRNNEDQFLIAKLDRSIHIHQASVAPTNGTRLAGSPQGWMMMVADGVGGSAGGELASKVAINTMATYAYALMPWSFVGPGADAPALARGFKQAIERCQMRIASEAESEHIQGKPGTTLTAAYVSWPNLYVAHVGDSRCYVMRSGRLFRLTRDHTYADQLHSIADVDEVEHSTLTKVLLNAVGGHDEDVHAELRHLQLESGDSILLCTNGLTSKLSDQQIAEHLAPLCPPTSKPVNLCVEELVQNATALGGEDDITAVVGRF
jgi:protein phosphatase